MNQRYQRDLHCYRVRVNLLLLQPEEVSTEGTARLTGRRLTHARDVLKVKAGQKIRVGVRGGSMGRGEVQSLDAESMILEVELADPPPPRANVSLILAIPRPKQLKRIIPAIASLGVDRVVLINAARVEKSYFDSKVLDRAFIDELIDLGLEQACDTIAPIIEVRERLKPFIEDELSTWAPERSQRLVPHPYADRSLSPVAAVQHVVLAIGPDGGWVPFEIELFKANGFEPVSIGARILRGEVAVPAIIGGLRVGSGDLGHPSP